MANVEIETGNIVKRYAFWDPTTWGIPKLYWDAFSQEQRIHAICRQLEKVIKYADYLGVNVDDIAGRLKAIEEGQLNDFIVAAIEEWFEENQPEILDRLDTIEADGWVTTQRLATGAVTSDKIADGTIATADIASGAVTNTKIANNAITHEKIADGSVKPEDLANGAVTNTKIADGAVTSDKIADGAVNTADIADGAVTSLKIADGAVAKLFNGCNILCITDSWGTEGQYNVTTAWMHQVCNALHANYIDLHQGSTGYCVAPTYLTRVQNYVAANPDMVSKIDAIIICGSVNDYAYDNTTLRNAIATTLNYLATTFSEAIIFYIIQPANDDMNLASVALNDRNCWAHVIMNNYGAVLNTPRNVIIVDSLVYSLLGNSALVNADHIHPTQAGHNILAMRFLTAILGSQMTYKQTLLGGPYFGAAQYQDVSTENVVSSSSIAPNNNYVAFDNEFHICRLDRIAATSVPSNMQKLDFALPNLVCANTQFIPGFGSCYTYQSNFAPMTVELVAEQKTFTSGTHRQTKIRLDAGQFAGANWSEGTHLLQWEIGIPLRFGF